MITEWNEEALEVLADNLRLFAECYSAHTLVKHNKAVIRALALGIDNIRQAQDHTWTDPHFETEKPLPAPSGVAIMLQHPE